MTVDQIWVHLRHPFELFFDPSQRLSLYYMVPALIAALLVYWFQRRKAGKGGMPSLLRWLVPMEVITHPSARADYVMFVINKSLILLIYASILIQSGFWVGVVHSILGPPGQEPATLTHVIVSTLVVILAMDFMLWLGHYIFHKVPFLWEFHKVHHSAEVMTPITAVRMHPFEEAISSMMGAFGIGISVGLLDHVFGHTTYQIQFFGINIFMALFFLAAFNLRHSHVWLRYPNWMQHIFVSPAQHQIHHSKAMRHWDKNMGFIFAFWDWIAGSLYSPKTHEKITYGLGNGEDGTWNNAVTLYFRPFKNAYMLFKSGWRNAWIFPPKHLRPREGQETPEAQDAP
ncbi:MAG: sterol desaturase family protein [Paracoccaceae bacterium]